jgi:hypothetical protein
MIVVPADSTWFDENEVHIALGAKVLRSQRFKQSPAGIGVNGDRFDSNVF